MNRAQKSFPYHDWELYAGFVVRATAVPENEMLRSIRASDIRS